ncbi:MAG: TAXI family TRAP transporter solute-binding subunit [Geminicoccaceae bacterium]
MIARMASWRRLAMISLWLGAQTCMAQQLQAQSIDDQEKSFLLGTASTGGTYHPVGVALATLIKLKLLPKFDVDLTAINTDGSQENANLLRRNEIQFAILSSLAGYDARTGSGEFANFGPDEELRAVTTLWLSTDHFAVRKADVKSGTVDDFLSLQGRPVSLGRVDSGTLDDNRALMNAFGLEVDTEFELAELGYDESAEALITGAIDGMSVSGGIPVGAMQDVFDALGDDVVVLEFSDEQLELIDGGRGLWSRSIVPAGTYPGQQREIFTVGTPNILAVRADVDEEVVYQITKAIFEELDYLHSLHGATQQISLDSAVTNLPMPIHEGALRYFKEKGVPLPPLPVEVDPDLLARYDNAAQARADVNREVITLFTGVSGDTSARAAAELMSVLNSAQADIRLLPTQGGGHGQNLTDLLYLKGVDAALMRADVVAYAEKENIYDPGEINYVTEMFPEEVHLLVRDDIADVRDLIDQKVNVGSPGSGTSITASIILSQLDLDVESTTYDSHVALEKLKQGEIAAAFFVGGKPMPILQGIEFGSSLKILPVPFVQYGDSYKPAEITGKDYPNLLEPNAKQPTLGVRSALITYSWRPTTQRYDALANFTNAFFGSLRTLHQDGRHPKWREVDPTSEFVGWQRFEPAKLWVDDNPGTAQSIVADGRRLIELAESNGLIAIEPSSLDAALAPPVTASVPVPSETERPTDGSLPPAGQTAIETDIITPAEKPAADQPAASVPTVSVPTNVVPTPTSPEAETSPQENGVSASSSRASSDGSEPPITIDGLPAASANAPTF